MFIAYISIYSEYRYIQNINQNYYQILSWQKLDINDTPTFNISLNFTSSGLSLKFFT